MLDPFTESSGVFLLTMSSEEIWKDISGYEGLYQVSTLGRVKSYDMRVPIRGGIQTRKGRMLCLCRNIDGYNEVTLCKKGHKKHWRVHRLVALAFISNPDNFPVINHKNEIKTDNRVENLEWCTVSYNNNYNNLQHRAMLTKKKNKTGFKPVAQYDLDGNFIAVYESTISAARCLGCYQGAISNSCSGRAKTAGGYIWRYVNNIHPRQNVSNKLFI
nr:MAG TPA: homing endonuclease [Bacteriophage sp.]